jgi:heme/copper-type cytochrome/quinol oxidase subunit 2
MTRRSKHKNNQNTQAGSQEATSAPSRSITQSPIKMLAIGIGILLIIIAIVNFAVGNIGSGIGTGNNQVAGSNNQVTGNSAGNNQALGGTLAPVVDGVQQVSVSMTGGTYMPNPIRVKVGVPVRMTVDLATVNGCYRSIRISELGVSGRVQQGSNTIEFTPSKAGVFRMTCGMGMADGMIIVEDESGNAPAGTANLAAPTARTGGSCGSNGGGCGCGG